MNYDEFAFFNRQLAAMLREGIPLEGALRQLSAGMRGGHLRAEVQRLEEDLARGTPLKEALGRRSLPAFYVRMVEVGTRSNDLPGVLTMLADHYHRANAIWTRLKGLLVYPVMVILLSLGLTAALSVIFTRFMGEFFSDLGAWQSSGAASVRMAVFMPPILLAMAAAAGIAALCIPKWRARLRWRLPAFHEASLSQLASAIALALRNGTPLPEALALAETLEAHTAADKVLARWRSLVETGLGKPSQWPAERPFPPLFLWLVQHGGEDLAAGFQKAVRPLPGPRRLPGGTRPLWRPAGFGPAPGHDGLLAGGAPAPGLCLAHEHAGRRVRAMNDWLAQLFPSDPLSAVLGAALFFAIYVILVLAPVCAALYLAYFLLTLPLRRNERARLLVDLLELGLKQGRTPEAALLGAASSGDPALGARFRRLSAYLGQGFRLSAALERVPGLLPPQVRAMLQTGEQHRGPHEGAARLPPVPRRRRLARPGRPELRSGTRPRC